MLILSYLYWPLLWPLFGELPGWTFKGGRAPQSSLLEVVKGTTSDLSTFVGILERCIP